MALIKHIVMIFHSQAIINMIVLIMANIIAIYWGHSARHDAMKLLTWGNVGTEDPHIPRKP